MNAFKFMTILTLGFIVISCSQNSTPLAILSGGSDQVKERQSQQVVEELQSAMVKYYQSPSLNLILISDDVQKSIAALNQGNGKLIYDPNNGMSSTIPFFIAELSAQQINDAEFIKSLNIKSFAVDKPNRAGAGAIKVLGPKVSSLAPIDFIPVDSVNLHALGNQQENGEGITVAVVDTGVDASHPAFEDRVVYWYDATDETKTKLIPVKEEEGIVTINENEIKLPENLPEGELLAAIIDEENFYLQLGEQDRQKYGFLDLNENQTKDKFAVLVSRSENGISIFIDNNGDMQFTYKDELSSLIDFNKTKHENRRQGMMKFPSRNNIISYPVLIEEDGEELYLTLGITSGSHGTHVAGIMAANQPEANLVGAAPKADIMSLKVCTGISCTDSAIIKGLYKAFYNGKVIPDVVNISLGSHERYAKGVYSRIFDDLSAKFGTIFFISASNSGPGFRSLNHIGNSGAVVMVGANVSRKTLMDQYNLLPNQLTYDENLLYFSSLGPSHSGEMKPNIIAPGGAVAPIIAKGGYMAQYNGTSMSSPLAAGAFAANLSRLKVTHPHIAEHIQERREKQLAGQAKAEESLLPYVYAMRDAIQSGAEEQAHLTRAQQGYGLMDVGGTQSYLADNLEQVMQGQKQYFEVVLNNGKTAYSRLNKIKRQQSFNLSIGEDGERPLSDKAKIIAKGVSVELSMVEEIDERGNVRKRYTDTDLFHIAARGDANEKLTLTKVPFNNGRTPGFISVRSLENMEKGKTYIAHYRVMLGNANVQNILDVVHMPRELKKRDIKVLAIDPEKRQTDSGLAFSDVLIKTNNFHRYHFNVTKNMTELHLNLAVNDETMGRLFLQIYNPDGRELTTVVAQNVPGKFEIAKHIQSTIKDGEVHEGVWEVTISAASSNWLSDAKYDLLIESKSFGVLKTRYEMSASKTLEIAAKTSTEKIKSVKVESITPIDIYELPIQSGHMTLQKLNAVDGQKVMQVSVIDEDTNMWGSIDHRLFEKTDTGFVPTELTDYQSKGGGYVRSFSNLPSDSSNLYYAINVISNYDMENNLEKSISRMVTVANFLPIDQKVKASATSHNLDGHDVSLIKIDVDKESLSHSNYWMTLKISGENHTQTLQVLVKNK